MFVTIAIPLCLRWNTNFILIDLPKEKRNIWNGGYFERDLFLFLSYIFLNSLFMNDSDCSGEIPMSFYTGTDKNDSPSLCVNGHL